MKKLLSLMAILPIAGTVVLTATSNAQAGVFQNGDNISGTGDLFAVGLDALITDPAQIYFGSLNPTPTAITLGKAGDTGTFAELGSSVDTTITSGATGGFSPFTIGTIGKIQSYQTGLTTSLISNFLTATSGPSLTVDIENNFFQAGFFPDAVTGPFFVGQVRAKVKRSDDPMVYDGIFRLSVQNIAPITVGPNAGLTTGLGNVSLVSNTESYSWALEVTATAVPEPSDVAGLLALGVLGGGVVLKRKLKR